MVFLNFKQLTYFMFEMQTEFVLYSRGWGGERRTHCCPPGYIPGEDNILSYNVKSHDV